MGKRTKKIQGKILFEVEERVNKVSCKKANELDGDTWLKYSISVWDDVSKTQKEAKLNHPALFPVELPRRLIRMFLTKDKKMVLDPFMGVGSTLLAAKELGKQGIGFEISKEYAEIAKNRLELLSADTFTSENVPYKIYVEDARNIDKYLQKESIDLCITSPPYWDILCEKRTADKKSIKNYHQKDGNLGEIHDYNMFLKELQGIFKKVFDVLKKGAYCIVVVMDIRKKNKFYPFHMDVIKFMQEIGFILDDIIIWDRKKEYNNLRPLGYPSIFRINKIHEYILIFIKPTDKK
jgi:DNA modification methylase